MAKRPIFIPGNHKDKLVETREVQFKWNPGFAVIQKKKNIKNLHDSAQNLNLYPILEVSTKSEQLIGRKLSAFNLQINTCIGIITVESAFQGSKVFENGGPFTELYRKSSVEAKRCQKLREVGKLKGFNFFGTWWPLEPKTVFYDWLYLSALITRQEELMKLIEYKGFSDIEFNPKKSINCQAKSCALAVALLKLDLLDEALNSKDYFIESCST
jgi:hypothetical protein